MTLYPYLNLFPLSLLSFLIKSKITFVYSIFIFHTLLNFIVSFYSSNDYIKSYKTAYVFSIIYSLSNTFLSYNIIGYDFGIISTYILLPLIIFGFMKIIHGYNSWLQLSIGMSLLLYSHIINVFIVSLFLLMILILNMNKHVLINLLKALLLFIILTSIFWIPFIQLYFNNWSNINMPIVKQLDNVPLKNFMSGLYGSKDTLTMGFFSIVSMFLSMFFYKKFNSAIKQIYLTALITTLIALFLPWKLITSNGILTVLNQFQYTWRLFIVPQMIFAFIFALIITKHINRSIVNIICIGVILFSILLQVFIGQYSMIKKFSQKPSINYLIKSNQKKDRLIVADNAFCYQIKNSSQFDRLLNSYSSEYDDYIPKSALSISSYVNHDLGVYNERYPIKVKHIGYNTFNFPGKNDINQLSLPIYTYNRENLYVYLNDKIVNNHINNNGLLTIDNIQHNIKPNNKIYLKSPHDPFKIIGTALSILGWLFVLIFIIKKKFVRK